MFSKIPVEVKLLILNHFNKKELKRLARLNKEFKNLTMDKQLEANKSYNLLIREIDKKIRELFPIQQKNKRIERFSHYDEYKINAHSDFAVLKSNILVFLNIMDLYTEVFDAKLSEKFPKIFKELNELVNTSIEINKLDKQNMIFHTYKNLEEIIKYLKKTNNPILRSISKLINLIINVEPSFYKLEPIDERPSTYWMSTF